MNDNKHFSNQLIDEINVDPGKNYFTEILIKTISKIGTKKKNTRCWMWQWCIYSDFKKKF